ncbi:MAG: TatD family hydrolase [Candidatus Omnitrophica bacterium]|nr:TatD family hydrolase [Candidatus Omnitrophota bacterium]
MFIDAHCHFNSLAGEKIDNISSSCSNGYIFIDSSINLGTTAISLQLSSKFPFIYSAIGFHPFSANEFTEATIAGYKKVLEENKKIVAIGEIGLDEFAETAPCKQEEIFCRFLGLAKEFNLPVIIHNRISKPVVFDILDKYFSSYEKIIFHCFSYSSDMLDKITAKGGYASFSLNILRKKKDIIESLKTVSLENMLLETDSPYMKINGQPSNPLDIKAVYAYAAEEKNLKIEEIENSVYSNAKKLFLFK